MKKSQSDAFLNNQVLCKYYDLFVEERYVY